MMGVLDDANEKIAELKKENTILKAIILVIICFVLLLGCTKQPIESQTKGEFVVEKLFTKDGCTVYRFDDYRTVYFTNCNGSTQYSESCGKNCTRNVEVD